MDHFKKFETMIRGLELKGRNWKKVVEYEGRQMDQGAMLIVVLREWLWRYMRKVDSEIVLKISTALRV